MAYMYHVFIFYFTGDGHLGCFHVLATVNSAAVHIGVLLELCAFLNYGFLRVYALVGLLGHIHCNFITSLKIR